MLYCAFGSNWQIFSLFTDLLFSQMIVERANENKNRGRLMTANGRGWGVGKRENIFSCAACALALALRSRTCALASLTRSFG